MNQSTPCPLLFSFDRELISLEEIAIPPDLPGSQTAKLVTPLTRIKATIKSCFTHVPLLPVVGARRAKARVTF